MKLLLDACVLFPMVTREILTAYARAGGFQPLWSARIVEEWARSAASKLGPEEEIRARGDAALMAAWFPAARVDGWENRVGEVWSPDPADVHVVAAALAGEADAIVTFNIRDFPLKSLRPHGIARLHPDEYLAVALRGGDKRLADVLAPLAAQAEARGAGFRAFLKRGAMPRLGKAWEAITA